MRVTVKNLTVKYGDFVAVSNLSFNASRGEILGILGPNGSGKTSTLRAILGLIPFDGEIVVDGYPAGSIEAKKRIGWMPQGSPLYSNLTIEENLRFFAKVYGIERNVATKRIDELLEFVELKAWRDKLVRNLSGGMKRRAMLACTLIHDPEILILDEPTAGVDPEQRRIFWEYFEGFSRQGKTILVTTHYLDEAEFCHRLVIMMNGRKISEGAPEEIKRKAKKEIIMLRTEVNRAVDVLKLLNLDFDVVGDEIIISSYDVKSTLPLVIEKLREKGVLIESIDIKRATVEDAFLELIRNVR
jgi:ABC-2 type transport system ATP-binding protein